jgi:hypothetical protein
VKVLLLIVSASQSPSTAQARTVFPLFCLTGERGIKFPATLLPFLPRTPAGRQRAVLLLRRFRLSEWTSSPRLFSRRTARRDGRGNLEDMILPSVEQYACAGLGHRMNQRPPELEREDCLRFHRLYDERWFTVEKFAFFAVQIPAPAHHRAFTRVPSFTA